MLDDVKYILHYYGFKTRIYTWDTGNLELIGDRGKYAINPICFLHQASKWEPNWNDSLLVCLLYGLDCYNV